MRSVAFASAIVLMAAGSLRVMFGGGDGGATSGAARVTVSVPVEIIEDGEAPAMRRVEVAR